MGHSIPGSFYTTNTPRAVEVFCLVECKGWQTLTCCIARNAQSYLLFTTSPCVLVQGPSLRQDWSWIQFHPHWICSVVYHATVSHPLFFFENFIKPVVKNGSVIHCPGPWLRKLLRFFDRQLGMVSHKSLEPLSARPPKYKRCIQIIHLHILSQRVKDQIW